MYAHVPERPEVYGLYHVTNDIELSRVCYVVDGESPWITNHLSDVIFELLEGSGDIHTLSTTQQFELHVPVIVPYRQAYRYAGKMVLSVDAIPLIAPPFITYGDQKLGRQEARVARAIRSDIAAGLTAAEAIAKHRNNFDKVAAGVLAYLKPGPVSPYSQEEELGYTIDAAL
jgi:hypothetical protein